jgi:hypothetical protein
MRGLGITSLILVILSTFLWLFSWTYWNVFSTSANMDNPLRHIVQACGFASTLTEYMAMGLLSIGLFIAGKQALQTNRANVG